MDENTKNKETAMKKKKLIGQIVLTSVFGVIIIGISLAIFFAKASGGLNNITTKELVDVTYAEGSTLRLTNNTPIFEDEIESRATEFNFTINNPNSTPVYATIDLTDISMSSALKNYDFKWALYEEGTKLTTGSFIDAETTLNLYNNSVINGNSNKTYKIRIWLNETGKTQNFQGTSFTSKVKVTAYSRQLRTLNSKILSDNTVNTNAPVFSTTSTDKGLYVQKEDSTKSEFGFPTYYYRGDVNNNYVSFARQLWRIIRINESGSIRLITENTINNGTEYTYNSDNTSVYGTSQIKTELEKWFNNIIASNKNKVEMDTFCNDITETFESKRSKNPVFTCPGTIYNLNIGMITADEALYAGSLWLENKTTNLTYLTDTENWWWTLTAHFSHLPINMSNTNGRLGFNTYANKTMPIRSVINLKSNVLIKSGDGTINNPYIISDANL